MGLPEPPPLGAQALPDGSYAGQVVLVTGGGTGLGKAIAVEFARLGAAVAIVSRSEEHRAAGVAAVEATGARALGVASDVRKPEAVAAAFDQHRGRARPARRAGQQRGGQLPGAGRGPVPERLAHRGRDRAERHLPLLARVRAAPHRRAARRASILNVGASYAWTGGPGFAHSAAAKAGVKNLTETLAVEWGPYGIRVNGLVPGLFPHEDETQAIRAVPERRKNDGARSPAGRVGHPRELGWAATFLASPYAAYISGHTLVVDGANWQRRAMLMPEFVPIREQLGKGPFEG